MARSSGPDAAGGSHTEGGAGSADGWGELEIEVTDLRTGETVERTLSGIPVEHPPDRIAPAHVSNGDGGDGGDTSYRKPMPASTRLAWVRQRAARGAVVVAVVAVVLVGLLASNPGISGAVRTSLFPPTPTLAPGTNVIWVRNVVPWGKLTIDGHAVPHPDALTPLTLSRGRHALTYDAPPFRTLRCTVSVPASPADTCPPDTQTQNEPNPPPDGERFFDLGAVPDKLSASNYTALMAALQRQLDTVTSATQLMPGDHYGTPDGQVRVAQRPIQVTLAFAVAPANPSGSAASYGGVECNPLCVMPDASNSYVTDWPVSAMVNAQWRYTGDDGTAQVVTSAAAGGAQTMVSAENMLTFSVRWTSHGWQVASPEISPFGGQGAAAECDVGMQSMPPMGSTAGSNSGYGISTGPNSAATPLADGCLITIIPQDGSGRSTGPSALLLVRCGALIAANDAAHTLFPALPVADGYEAALARRLGS